MWKAQALMLTTWHTEWAVGETRMNIIFQRRGHNLHLDESCLNMLVLKVIICRSIINERLWRTAHIEKNSWIVNFATFEDEAWLIISGIGLVGEVFLCMWDWSAYLIWFCIWFLLFFLLLSIAFLPTYQSTTNSFLDTHTAWIRIQWVQVPVVSHFSCNLCHLRKRSLPICICNIWYIIYAL